MVCYWPKDSLPFEQKIILASAFICLSLGLLHKKQHGPDRTISSLKFSICVMVHR